MTNTSKTILFFGTEDFSATSLQALIDNGYPVAAVITKPDSKKGRGQKLVPPAVKEIAIRHNLEVWQPAKIGDIAAKISKFNQPVGVLVSFGKIIPQTIIDLFEPGIINVHPSLLPLYRGPSPIEQAILNGDKQTGVSIMQLSARMDAGPVYTQTTVELSGQETKPELYQLLAERGAKALVDSLDEIISGELAPIPQDEAVTSYTKLLSKDDGLIDPTQQSATQIERAVRAFIGYPKTRLTFKGVPVIVTKAHVANQPDETTIECADDSWLAIDSLISPTGKQMTTQAYLRGLHLQA